MRVLWVPIWFGASGHRRGLSFRAGFRDCENVLCVSRFSLGMWGLLIPAYNLLK